MFFNWYKTAQIKSRMIHSLDQADFPDRIFFSYKATKDLESMDKARKQAIIDSIKNWPHNVGSFTLTKNLHKLEVSYLNKPRVMYFQCKEDEDIVMYIYRCFPTHAEYNKALPSLANVPNFCADNNGEKNPQLLSLFNRTPWYENKKDKKQKIDIQIYPVFDFAVSCYQKFKLDGQKGLEEVLEEIKKLDENKIYDLINEIEKINSSDKSFENFIKNILKNKIFQIWDSKMSNL